MAYERKEINDIETLRSIRLSPSSMNTFSQCPRRWYYQYIKALESLPSIHLVRGNVIHKTLEDIFKQYAYGNGEDFRNNMLDKALQTFENEWSLAKNNVENTDIEFKEDVYKESKLMITKFVHKFCDNIQSAINMRKCSSFSQGFYLLKPKFKELWIDDNFRMNKNGYPIMENMAKVPIENSLNVGGFIDSVQKDFDGNLFLIDYKTSTKYKNVLSAEYIFQLGVYAYLWYRQYNELPSYVGINYLKYDESFYVLVTPSMIKEVVEHIKSIRNQLNEFGLEENNYFKKESKLCDWCSYKDICTGIKDIPVMETRKDEQTDKSNDIC